LRPDRVLVNHNRAKIIDYKFGEQKEQHHKRQIKVYKDKLHQLGYKHVEGYIWYINQKEVITV